MNNIQSNDLLTAVQKGSRNWQNAFNAGNAEGCANCYEKDAELRAKPIGEFKGRAQIRMFWSNLIRDGFNSVEYIDPQIMVVTEDSAILSANWRMNKAHGVIVKELWVLQPNGAALLREDEFEVQQ